MRLLRITGTLLIGLLLVCQIALAATMSLASRTGYQVLVITGGSMEPTYHLGSALLLKDLAEDEVTVGDAVTYTSVEGTLTTHRVIATPKRQGVQYLQTQGDANAEPDPNFVPAAAVVGTPVAHLPYGGYVTSFLLSPLGRLLVFGPPLAALLLVQVRLIRAALRRPGSASPQPKQPVPVPAAGSASLGVVPLVVVVLAGSALAGTMVARSTATFTNVAYSTGSVISTGTSGAPLNLTGDRITGRNTLNWAAPSWAPSDGYRIYRAAGFGADFTPIAQVPVGQTTYTDGGGNANSVYQVRSVSGGVEGDPAGPVGVK